MKSVLYVKVSLNPDFTVKESTCEEIKVLKMNGTCAVLDNETFTTLNLKAKKYTVNGNLDDICIKEYNEKVMIDIFGKFCIRMYSSKSLKVTENRINKAFNKWINEKLSVYGQGKAVNIKLEVK